MPLRLGPPLALLLGMLLAQRAAAQPPVRLPTVIPEESVFRQPTFPQQDFTQGGAPSLLAPDGTTAPTAGADGLASPRTGELVSQRPDQVSPIYLNEEEPLTPKKPGEGKDGFLQDVTLMGTWLPQPEEGSLGFTDASLSVTGGVPFPTRDLPMLITTYFETKFLDGPDSPDLPSKLYTAYMQFRWLPKLNDYWRLDIGVAPGWYSDFQSSDEQSFRMTGRALGILTWHDSLIVAAGILYLDRPDVDLLPVGGIIWTPNDDWKIELIFPRPKLYKRFAVVNATFPEEYWFTFAGEFGGDAWAIQQANGDSTKIVMRDYRVILGLERRLPGIISTFVEGGYVFGRIVEFEDNTPDYEPADTWLVRAGARY